MRDKWTITGRVGWSSRSRGSCFVILCLFTLLTSGSVVFAQQQPLSPTAIQKLIDTLNDPANDEKSRQEIRDTLRRQDFKTVRGILKKELGKAERRLAAIDLYAAFGRGDSAEDIVQYLQGDDPELSRATLKAFIRMGEIPAEPVIQKVLDGLNACAPTADLRQIFLDVLVAQDFARLRPMLKKELQKDNRRLVAIEVYSDFAREEGADDIVQFLKTEDRDLRKATIGALAKIGGEKAAEGLLNEFKSKKADDPMYSEYLDCFEKIPFSAKVIDHFLSVLGTAELRSKAISILSKQMCKVFVDDATAATVIPEYWQANKAKLQLYFAKFKDVPGWQSLFSAKDIANIKKFGKNLCFAVGTRAVVQLADKFDTSCDWEAVLFVLLFDANEKKGQDKTEILHVVMDPARQEDRCGALRVLKNGFSTTGEGGYLEADNTQKWAEVKIQRKADRLYHFVNGKQVCLTPYGLKGVPVHSIIVCAGEYGLLIGGARIRTLK